MPRETFQRFFKGVLAVQYEVDYDGRWITIRQGQHSLVLQRPDWESICRFISEQDAPERTGRSGRTDDMRKAH